VSTDAYYIVQGSLNSTCDDLNCTTRVLNASETSGVSCCADNSVGSDNSVSGSFWTFVDSCNIWVISHLFNHGRDNQDSCYITTWKKAAWLCDKAGGRLCTKDELEKGCATNRRNTCGFDSYIVWSSTSGEIVDTPLDEDSTDSVATAEYYAVQGSSGEYCWESTCDTTTVSHYDVKAVGCCFETELEGNWVKNDNCEVWSDSSVPFCNIVNWGTANRTCSKLGSRFCSKTELENNCARHLGCFFNRMLVWSSNRVPIVYPTDSPTLTPTKSPSPRLTDPPTILLTDRPSKTPTDSPTLTSTDSIRNHIHEENWFWAMISALFCIVVGICYKCKRYRLAKKMKDENKEAISKSESIRCECFACCTYVKENTENGDCSTMVGDQEDEMSDGADQVVELIIKTRIR